MSLVCEKHTLREMAKYLCINVVQASALRTGHPSVSLKDIEDAIEIYANADLPDMEIDEGLAKAWGVSRG
jgi:hypothetical protein